MALDFPSNPSNNQIYTYNNQSWYWANNFGVWKVSISPLIGGGNTQVFFNDSNYINAVSSFTFNKSDNTFTAGVFTANTTAAYFNSNILPTNNYIITNAITFTGGVKTFSANTSFNANVAYGTNILSVDTVNNRVGVGNTAPVAELDIYGNYAHIVVPVTASDVDCSQGNYFTKTISGVTTFTFSNAPANRAFGFVLELTNGGSSTVNWPGTVKWPNASAPTLTTSGVDILVFITDDGGTIWRGVSAMINSS